jgi:hypothetical protein
MAPLLLELFSGTKSIGRAFEALEWKVISLDSDPKTNPTICCNILEWEYKSYKPGHFDVIWASPPCTEYSTAKTIGARNLVLADAIVKKVLEIIDYFKPVCYAIENPQTGLLKSRSFMEGIPFTDTSYCKFGYPYRKRTRIWHNLGEYLSLPPMCCKHNPCAHAQQTGGHPQSAQRGPCKKKGIRQAADVCTLQQLYSIPSGMCDQIALACDLLYSIEKTKRDILASYNVQAPTMGSKSSQEEEPTAI